MSNEDVLLVLTNLPDRDSARRVAHALIESRAAAYPRLEAVIRAQHSYELPEIIAVSVNAGLPGYLQWVAQETSATPPG